MSNNIFDDKLNNQHPSDEKKSGLPEVPLYANMLSARRQNTRVPGFDFDVDTFENLIDCYTPYENIPLLLSGTSGKMYTETDIDNFCKLVYKMDFKTTYKLLIGITDMQMRKVFKNLAASGNATAIAINAKHFMKLEEDAKNDAINIRIVNDLENK